MQHKFEVTGLGITIDGRAVMPGSTLYLKAAPPSHWQRFGRHTTGEAARKPQSLEVATPAAEDQQEDKPRRGRPRRKSQDD